MQITGKRTPTHGPQVMRIQITPGLKVMRIQETGTHGPRVMRIQTAGMLVEKSHGLNLRALTDGYGANANLRRARELVRSSCDDHKGRRKVGEGLRSQCIGGNLTCIFYKGKAAEGGGEEGGVEGAVALRVVLIKIIRAGAVQSLNVTGV
ncbi:hypothetical protein E2C01_020186 [Portunus trituberculatus]|uniref:Uncharacterized protein n=1 Tax=Portunus trituberculatus TaxID=210409 RepID=A0A5B7E2H3_PORTR|nr:hypothetical protein [Portunus trituberculatus]